MQVKDIIRFTEWMPNPRRPMERPLFSILMPTYCRFGSGHLTRTIQSVLDQSYAQFELIIIDDGLVDGSFGEIQRFMQLDTRIHCLQHPRNIGLPALSCYEGFLKARGEYIMFCFEGTVYDKEALENLARYFSSQHPKIAFGHIDINGPLPHIRQTSSNGHEKFSQSSLIITNLLPRSGVILHREVPDKIGFLDPHFALAGLADWDYWRRAARMYEIRDSSIAIGREHDVVTEEDLKNTPALNMWVMTEWMEQDRNVFLTPGNYEEYDIQTIPDHLSQRTKSVLRDISGRYRNKFWYHDPAQLADTKTSLADGLDANSKFLVVVNAQSASVSLTFEFVPGAERSIRYSSPIHHKPTEMLEATAVIFARDILQDPYQRWIRIAQQLDIPHYYYVDDNLILVGEDLDEFRKYTLERLQKELASFQSVLVPSQSLANFFIEKRIHPRVLVIPPVRPPLVWLDNAAIPNKPAGTIRIGFMGGSHRHREFVQLVLPAIKRLASHRAVELVIGGTLSLDPDEHSQFKVYFFPFNISYRLTLGRMQVAGIDILVHAGSDTRNNPYKTHNVLLNAWALQAFPILANQPPYEDVEKLGLGLLCRNADEWYQNLQRAISESDLVSQVQANLDRYVHDNFSGQQNLDILKSISQECPSPGVAVIDSRYQLYIDMLERETQQLFNWAAVVARGRSRLREIIQQNRSWLLPANSPQERLARFLFRRFFCG